MQDSSILKNILSNKKAIKDPIVKPSNPEEDDRHQPSTKNMHEMALKLSFGEVENTEHETISKQEIDKLGLLRAQGVVIVPKEQDEGDWNRSEVLQKEHLKKSKN